jgi:hypothetical protein
LTGVSRGEPFRHGVLEAHLGFQPAVETESANLFDNHKGIMTIGILVAVVVVVGGATVYFAVRSREYRKFLAGAFFVSGGMQFYFWQVNLPVPLYNTGIVQSPDVSLIRSVIHFGLFLTCLYFGFFWKAKR